MSGITDGQTPKSGDTMSVTPATRSRAWCFTDFALERVDAWKALEPKVLVIALEEGNETKKQHLQGYIRFDKVIRLSYLISRIGVGFHAEPRIASEAAAIQYIMDVDAYKSSSPFAHEKSQGVILVDHGVDIPERARKKARKETVEEEVVRRLDEGESIQDIRKNHRVYVYRHWKMMRSYVRLLEAWGERRDGDSSSNGANVE